MMAAPISALNVLIAHFEVKISGLDEFCAC